MYNIKLKSVPNKAKTGSQLDYSLVDRNTLFLKPNTPVDSDVKNTMGAVPRDKANIEAEGGETVIGDINNDGFLEHQTIVGKRHTQGGVPLNVPEGSFIFSDTKKMIIKDPEVLAMFGMKPSKKGYTPAEIAKKYNINDYIAILKDPAKDKYAKETAEIMLESNLKKLGMLALIQESMKGFPDGVPAIAESVMGQMQGGSEETQESPEEEASEGPQGEMAEGEQPQQKYGGQLSKAQLGKNITGRTIYYHNQPYVIGSPDAKQLSSFRRNEDSDIFPIDYIGDDGKVEKKYFSKRELDRILNPTKDQQAYDKVYNARTQYSSNKAWDDLQSAPVRTQRNLMKNLHLETGDKLSYGDNNYQVINPWGENGEDYIHSGKRWRDSLDNTEGIIHVKNLKTGQDEFLEGEDIKDQYRVDPNGLKIQRGTLPLRVATDQNDAAVKAPAPMNPVSTAPAPVNPNAGTSNQQASQRAAAQRDAARIAQEKAAEANAQQQQTAPQPVQPNTSAPTVRVRIKTPPANNQPISNKQSINGVDVESDPNLAYGGSIHKYQVAGTTTEPQNTTTPSPSKKIVKYIWGEKTQRMYAKYDDGTTGETPYTKLITREQRVDPNTKAKNWGYSVQFPNDMSAKDKASVVDSITDDDALKMVRQHSNQIIDKNNPYKHFYGNTRPQDYEDRLVRKNLGDQATDAMDEITKRKKAFEILGIKGVADTDLKDASRLYNDPYFFDKQFYPAFTSKLPQGTFRPQMGNDTNLGWEHLKAITAPVKPAETTPEEDINIAKVDKPYIKPNFRNDGWWLQDRVNFAGTLTDPVHAYFPAMAHHDYVTPGYVLNDPTTQLRAVQQGVKSLQDQGFNSMSGNVAMAAASGINGQGIDKAAEVIGNVNNSNVGIVNNAAARNAEITNRGIDQNENDKATYMANVSRTLENLDKANSFNKWRRIAAYNNGVTNWQRKNQYEDQVDPNSFIDPITGHVSKHGYDTAQLDDSGHFIYNPHQSYTSGAVSPIDVDSLYEYYKKSGANHQEAVDKVNLQLKAHAIKSGKVGNYGSGYNAGQYPGGYGATAASAYGYDD